MDRVAQRLERLLPPQHEVDSLTTYHTLLCVRIRSQTVWFCVGVCVGELGMSKQYAVCCYNLLVTFKINSKLLFGISIEYCLS